MTTNPTKRHERLEHENGGRLPAAVEAISYKGAHGGRGSGKSHFFAGLIIEHCLAEQPSNNGGERLRVVCIREQLSDLKESAKLSSSMSGLTLPNLQAL